MTPDFRKRMGLSQTDQVEARARFVNRINVSIFRWLQDWTRTIFYNQDFIWWLSEQMGEPWGRHVRQNEFNGEYYVGINMEQMAVGDFYKNLELIEKSYQYIEEDRANHIGGHHYGLDEDKIINLRHFEERMQRIMLLSEADLGIFWKDGKFYPSGAKELDEALVADTLDWLETYPATRKQFSVALGHYEKSLKDISAGKDAITNCYTSIESLAQEFLQNTKNFDNNSDGLVDKLGLPKEYKNVVHWYKQMANEYGSRHAGSDPCPKEVEAFVYLTGLLLRLISNPN